jgi:hypothetical protein
MASRSLGFQLFGFHFAEAGPARFSISVISVSLARRQGYFGSSLFGLGKCCDEYWLDLFFVHVLEHHP